MPTPKKTGGYFNDLLGQTSCRAYKRVEDCPAGQTQLVFSHVNTADHQCQACSGCTGPNDVMVVASGKDVTNPCSGGHPYFACLDDRQLYTGLNANQRMQYKLNDANDDKARGYDAIEISVCNDQLLPAYAAWIDYRPPSHVAKQCYFSCQYGLGPSAESLQRLLKESMSGTHEFDLYTVLQSPAKPIPDNTKVRLPRRWKGGQPQPTQPSMWASVLDVGSAATSPDVSNEYSRRNIFFFKDSVLSSFGQNRSDVCLPPKSVSQSCQSSWHDGADLGAWGVSDQWMGQPCAWLAAQNGVARVAFPGGGYGYAVLMPDPLNARGFVAGCTASVSTLDSTAASSNADFVVQTWYYGCYANRVDVMQRLIGEGLNDAAISDYQSSERLQKLQYWLKPQSWYLQMKMGDTFNPYTFDSQGVMQCVVSKDYPSFLVPLAGLIQFAGTKYASGAACVPCGDNYMQSRNEALCDLFLSTAQDKYHFVGCPSSFSMSTLRIDQVCQNCERFGNAELITKAGNPAVFDAWLLSLPATDTSDWSCRYKCSSGYYRNTQASYKSQPCLLCPTAGVGMCEPGEFFDADAVGAMCPADGISPLKRPCRRCAVLNASLSGQLLLPSSVLSAVATQGDCLGFCDPSLYHTVKKGGGYVSGAVNQSLIADCEPCTANLAIPCHGACAAGHYLNAVNMTCPVCNVGVCPLGQYRTDCPLNATLDTTCSACDDSLLLNPPALLSLPALFLSDNQTANLKASLQSSQGVIVKRWLPGQPLYDSLTDVQLMQQFSVLRVSKSDALKPTLGCYLTCRNNFVWIDASTQQHPLVNVQKSAAGELTNKAFFICIPCSSVFISMFYTGSLPLYSVWNTSSAPPASLSGSPLSRMATYKGACAACSDAGHEVIDASDVFCDVKVGYGTLNAAAQLVSYLISSLQPANMLYTSNASDSVKPLVTLSQAGGPEPILNSPNFAFFCCGDLHYNTELQHKCYQMKSLASYNTFLKDVRKGMLDFSASTCNASTSFDAAR